MSNTNVIFEEKTVSLFEFIFEENILSSFFCGIIFFLAAIGFYLFFENYFSTKKNLSENPDFINNIEDFIQESRIDSAMDYCVDIDSPISRIIHSGLTRIGKPVGEISLTLENNKKLEYFSVNKGFKSLKNIALLILLLGFFGTFLQMVCYFSGIFNHISSELDVVKSIYISCMCLTLSTLFSTVFLILQSKTDENLNLVKVKIQKDINTFLDILNKPI